MEEKLKDKVREWMYEDNIALSEPNIDFVYKRTKARISPDTSAYSAYLSAAIDFKLLREEW